MIFSGEIQGCCSTAGVASARVSCACDVRCPLVSWDQAVKESVECVLCLSLQQVPVGEHQHQPVCDQPAVALHAGLVCRSSVCNHQLRPHPVQRQQAALPHGEHIQVLAVLPAVTWNVSTTELKPIFFPPGHTLGLNINVYVNINSITVL